MVTRDSGGYHLRRLASASVRLFVYGSLKRGGRHHGELLRARFLAEAETEPGYALTDLGEYLALVSAPEAASTVKGELFEVDVRHLQPLDDFEGDAYEHGPVALSPQHSGGFKDALAYFRKAR